MKCNKVFREKFEQRGMSSLYFADLEKEVGLSLRWIILLMEHVPLAVIHVDYNKCVLMRKEKVNIFASLPQQI